jgi:hypothetical protein
MRAITVLFATVALAGVLSFAGGCGSQPGKTIITQGANAEPVMGNATESGEYMLYTAASPNPTATVRLNSGDPLGFRRADDGHLVAVAGQQSFDLPKGTVQAYWKLQGGK